VTKSKISRNIEKRKGAEYALSVFELRYRRLFESANEGILFLDADTGLILDVNPHLTDLLGYSHKVLLNKKIWEIGFLKDVLANRAKFNELKAKGYVHYEHLPLESAKGKKIDVEFLSNVYTVDNAKVMQCNIRDITERKKAEDDIARKEQYYRSLICNLQEDIVVIDKGYKITDINNTQMTTTGHKRENIIGKPCYKVFHGYGKPCTSHGEDCRLSEVLKTGKPCRCQHVHKHVDGSSVSVDIILSPLVDEKGKVVKVIGSMRDITDVKKSEEELKNAYEDLKSLDELKTNVIANVSHELRTPITIVKGVMEIAIDANDREERNKLLKVGLNALNRQNMIVEDLVGASKLHRGLSDLKLEPLDINSVLHLILGEFDPSLKKTGIKTKVRVKKPLPRVQADFEKIGHVLRNIISNAIKFSSPECMITLLAAKKGNFVEVCVNDEGVGISKKEQEKVFGLLYQSESGTGRNHGGTGMGLSIAKEFVEIQGGEVTMKSTLRKGSTFCFTLPIAKEKR
jgi:PAS domain S-box-containing protein